MLGLRSVSSEIWGKWEQPQLMVQIVMWQDRCVQVKCRPGSIAVLTMSRDCSFPTSVNQRETGIRFFCCTCPGSSWLQGRVMLCPVHPVMLCMGRGTSMGHLLLHSALLLTNRVMYRWCASQQPDHDGSHVQKIALCYRPWHALSALLDHVVQKMLVGEQPLYTNDDVSAIRTSPCKESAMMLGSANGALKSG